MCLGTPKTARRGFRLGLEGLERLQGLTELLLEHAGPLPELGAVAALSGLRSLNLCFQCPSQAHSQVERMLSPWEPISSLTRLTKLELRIDSLLALPGCLDPVWRSPCLKVSARAALLVGALCLHACSVHPI